MIPQLGVRAISGAAYAGLLLAALLPVWPLWVPLVVTLGILGYLELTRLLRRSLHGGALLIGLVAGGLYVAIGIAALMNLQFAWAGERGSLLGITHGRWALLALVVTWASDVAAYLVGSTLGRRRLAPRISPGKTWEGTLGGFAAAALAAAAFGSAYEMSPAGIAIVAALSGPAALAGDLAESAVKRAAGVKDSGRLIPGHGGALDRIDSLLLVAPLVYVASLVARGLG
ncbi:MAG: phosphatidate cytidylyltransferase [Chloroflexi bacterium]|nr:phosphatidate cytidylyltransferase [Chloroflexota bacterium]